MMPGWWLDGWRMDGVDGWRVGGWVDGGWVDGCMDGWMGGTLTDEKPYQALCPPHTHTLFCAALVHSLPGTTHNRKPTSNGELRT